MIAEYGWAIVIFPGLLLVGGLILMVALLKHSKNVKALNAEIHVFEESALKVDSISECFDLLHLISNYRDKKNAELIVPQITQINRTITYLNGVKKGLEINKETERNENS